MTRVSQAQAYDKLVIKVGKGASPGEVIGVIKVNGEAQVIVRVPPGSEPGKVRWLKVQVPRPPGSKAYFEYDSEALPEYVPPDEGSVTLQVRS